MVFGTPEISPWFTRGFQNWKMPAEVVDAEVVEEGGRKGRDGGPARD